MRQQAPGEYYHIYNRGMHKQPVFETDSDRFRFLFLILTLQGGSPIKNISRQVKRSVQSSTLHIDEDLRSEVLQNRMVELVHFCLMPNHFHLVVGEIVDNGIAKYMQRVLTAYTKYFNVRHEKSGHLFQGPYKSKHIGDDEQLMHLSAYIHKNPCELKGWKGREDNYYWSSYQDCVKENRFSELLRTTVVTDRYEENIIEYGKFVRSSLAKELIE